MTICLVSHLYLSQIVRLLYQMPYSRQITLHNAIALTGQISWVNSYSVSWRGITVYLWYSYV